VIRKMINLLRIGQYYKDLYGKNMERMLLHVHHIYLVHFIDPHANVLKRFLVDIRHGNFLCIYIALSQDCFTMFFQKNTGSIFANLSMKRGL
jgi:hypothetical protein